MTIACRALPARQAYPDNRDMRIGSVVRARRVERGITQEALALELETATSTLSRIEKNQRTPSLDLLVRLAKALDLKPSELLHAAETVDGLPAAVRLGETSLLYQDEAVRVSHLFRRLDARNRQLGLDMLKVLLQHQAQVAASPRGQGPARSGLDGSARARGDGHDGATPSVDGRADGATRSPQGDHTRSMPHDDAPTGTARNMADAAPAVAGIDRHGRRFRPKD